MEMEERRGGGTRNGGDGGAYADRLFRLCSSLSAGLMLPPPTLPPPLPLLPPQEDLPTPRRPSSSPSESQHEFSEEQGADSRSFRAAGTRSSSTLGANGVGGTGADASLLQQLRRHGAPP